MNPHGTYLSLLVLLIVAYGCKKKPDSVPPPPAPVTVKPPTVYTDTFNGHTAWSMYLDFWGGFENEYDEPLYFRREDSIVTIWSDNQQTIPVHNIMRYDTMRHFWAYRFQYNPAGYYNTSLNPTQIYYCYRFRVTKDSLYGYWARPTSKAGTEGLYFAGGKK